MELSKLYQSSDLRIEELTISQSEEVNGGLIQALPALGVTMICGAIFLAPLAIAFYAGYHSMG